jgi:hypothetical protein
MYCEYAIIKMKSILTALDLDCFQFQGSTVSGKIRNPGFFTCVFPFGSHLVLLILKSPFRD